MKRTVSIILLTVAVCAGCQTPPTSMRLQSTAYAVLSEHHFAPPYFTASREGMISAVAARPLSDSSVQTVCLKFQRDGRASVEITSYQYVGSDWATLGRLFDQGRCQQEAAEIEQSVDSRLKTP